MINLYLLEDLCIAARQIDRSSIDVPDTFDLLLLSEQTSHLASQLLESLHSYGHPHPNTLTRHNFHVDLWPQHLAHIVCAQDYVYFP